MLSFYGDFSLNITLSLKVGENVVWVSSSLNSDERPRTSLKMYDLVIIWEKKSLTLVVYWSQETTHDRYIALTLTLSRHGSNALIFWTKHAVLNVSINYHVNGAGSYRQNIFVLEEVVVCEAEGFLWGCGVLQGTHTTGNHLKHTHITLVTNSCAAKCLLGHKIRRQLMYCMWCLSLDFCLPLYVVHKKCLYHTPG